MGASEGTLLAAEAAARAPDKVKGGLILYAILSSTLKDMLRFQAADGPFLVMNRVFDADKDGKTSKAEYEVDPRKTPRCDFKPRPLKPSTRIMMASSHKRISERSENRCSMRSMRTFLSQLTIPVGLFHGNADNLTPVEGTKALEALAKRAGKSNLEFQYFDGLDHSLGIGSWFVRGTMPEGHKAIFAFIRAKTGATR